MAKPSRLEEYQVHIGSEVSPALSEGQVEFVLKRLEGRSPALSWGSLPAGIRVNVTISVFTEGGIGDAALTGAWALRDALFKVRPGLMKIRLTDLEVHLVRAEQPQAVAS